LDSSNSWVYEWQTKKYAIETYTLSSVGKRLTNADIYNFGKGDVFQIYKQEGAKLVKTKILDRVDFTDSIKYSTEVVSESLWMGYTFEGMVQKDWWILNSGNFYTKLYPEQYSYVNGQFKEITYPINKCAWLL